MKQEVKGIWLAIIGTSFWGISGPFAQNLFTQNINPLWLVGLRLTIAGSILTLWGALQYPEQFRQLLEWHNLKRLLLFSLFGMVPSQLTYFLAISYANASTATILQFLGPSFIVIYLALKTQKMPARIDLICLVISLLGTILVVTNGSFSSLALSGLGMFWGIMAGFSQASYTLLPRKLLEDFDAKLVTGLGMFIGSLLFWPLLIIKHPATVNSSMLLSFDYIIIFGTMAAYLCYLQSVKFIPAATTGMLSAFEPLTANIVSVLWLQEMLGGFQTLGAILILMTVFLQALAVKKT